MRRLFMLSILLLAPGVHAGDPLEARMRDMLSLTAMNHGASHELAKRCGADTEALAAFETRVSAEAEELKAQYDHLDVKFSRVYAKGRQVGERQYLELGQDADDSDTCTRAIAALTCTGLMC